MRKSPGFTLTVIVTLALGIGANAAIFTLFDQVLLRMLPVERPKELVRFEWKGAFSGSASSLAATQQLFPPIRCTRTLRDKNQVFTDVLAADRAGVGVSWHNQAESKDAEIVTGNYFTASRPASGRGRPLHAAGRFGEECQSRSGAELRLLEDALQCIARCDWPGRAGKRPLLLHPRRLRRRTSTLPSAATSPASSFPSLCRMWQCPWMVSRDNLHSHESIWLTLIARLKPGVTRTQAEASLGPLWHSLRAYAFTLYKGMSGNFRKKFVE